MPLYKRQRQLNRKAIYTVYMYFFQIKRLCTRQIMAVLEVLVLSLTQQAEQEVAAGEILNVAIKKQCQIFIST